MQFRPTDLPGVVLIEPDVHRDARGYFLETYHAEKYRAGGIEGPFVQGSHSRSIAATLRGLHLQRRFPQGKLIRVEAKGIRVSGRSTQGVKLIDTSDGDKVASASLIERQEDETGATEP